MATRDPDTGLLDYITSVLFPQNESQQSAVRGERGAVPTHCLINSNLIRPLTSTSLDLDSEEGGGTRAEIWAKIQLVSVCHKRKLQVVPKSLTRAVQKVMATCSPPWETQRRQEKSVSVLREQE